ncbi:MAG: argininosuccinate lyase [Spirochaetaceae bacterium]|nr:argininosuccinate lyase [Spirochaetaceae bacterium]MBO4728861.1 argininosuccinate lyase [Spirochaetaceae bacterium]MBR4824209.1 argininosuccinate lyase [Spirochaetaceae bacterium]
MSEKKSAVDGGNHAALWHGRFAEGPDAEAVAFETSIHVDSRMALDDIRGSIAHASMLGKTGIIPSEEADAITAELAQIAVEIKTGKLEIDTSAEDIHSFIEGVLTDRLGDAGRKVHTGRSRNDQIALDERLYLKHAVPDLRKAVTDLISALVDIAEKNLDTLMSGYTHMQRAQPVSLAHHLCAWCQMLVRDCGRLDDALKRIDLSPLGAGALAGSGLPLNREMTARDLDFSGVTANSLDTVADRDYCIELAACFSLLMTHLSRFCEEVVLWSTEEFKFIDLSEKWSTGSSIMPQKKNPDFAELIRGRTGRVYGNLIALLTMMKGLPLSYNRDLQEDKQSLFEAYDTALSCVRIFTYMISTARWNKDRMAASCVGGYANATDLADYLVRKGMPFRTAHAVAASAVRKGIEKHKNLEDMSLSELREAAGSDLICNDVFERIDPRQCAEARRTTGGPAAEKVKEQIQDLRRFIK